jgi:hypothetical protein
MHNKVTVFGPSDWAENEISEAKSLNIISDNSDYNYQEEITRKEFCELLVDATEKLSNNEISIKNYTNPFEDTENISVLKASKIGIVNGTSFNTFNPNNKIKREEIFVMITRALKTLNPRIKANNFDLTSIKDFNDISSWAIDSVSVLKTNGIIKGMGENKINPKGNAKKEEALIMIYRSYTNILNN